MEVFQFDLVPLSRGPVLWVIRCEYRYVGGIGRVIVSQGLLRIQRSGTVCLAILGFSTLAWTLVWCPHLRTPVISPSLVYNSASWWRRYWSAFWSSPGTSFCRGLPAFCLAWAFPRRRGVSFLEPPGYEFYRPVFVRFLGSRLLVCFFGCKNGNVGTFGRIVMPYRLVGVLRLGTLVTCRISLARVGFPEGFVSHLGVNGGRPWSRLST